MDLNQSVIMPREDFMELQIAAWDKDPTPLKERVAQSAQTTFVMSMLAAVTVAGTWGCVKAVDWLEQRRIDRQIAQQTTTKTHE